MKNVAECWNFLPFSVLEKHTVRLSLPPIWGCDHFICISINPLGKDDICHCLRIFDLILVWEMIHCILYCFSGFETVIPFWLLDQGDRLQKSWLPQPFPSRFWVLEDEDTPQQRYKWKTVSGSHGAVAQLDDTRVGPVTFVTLKGACGKTTTTIHQYKIPATLQIQVQTKTAFLPFFLSIPAMGGFSEKKKEDITPSHSLASSQYVGARSGLNKYLHLLPPKGLPFFYHRYHHCFFGFLKA